MSAAQRILVIGPAWVGDMVMAQSLFKTLRAQDAQLEIDVVGPSWSVPVLARMPELADAIELPVGHGRLGLGPRWRLAKRLRARGYQRAIVLPRSFKAALIPWLARIPQRTGYRGELRYGLLTDMRALDRSVLTQTVQRYVALGLPAGADLRRLTVPAPALRVDGRNQRRLLDALALSTEPPVIGLLPGAEYGPAKRWAPESFAQVARAMTAQGRQVWIFGSSKERDLGEQICRLAATADVHNLCGRTSLAEVIDLLAATRAVVTNDSGLMHVAAAVGTSVVAVYGSSTPAYTPPLTDRKAVHYLDVACSPCFKRTCPYGHTRCLRDITPDQIVTSLNEIS